MTRQEFDRLIAWVDEKASLWDLHQPPLLNGGDTMRHLFLLGYEELFADQPTDFTAFADGDPGPTQEYGGAELEAGIFNVVMHLVRLRAQTSTPYAARAQVAAWLEEIATGLKQFATPEE